MAGPVQAKRIIYDGYNPRTGKYVEVEYDTTTRSADILDYSTGKYSYADVDNIRTTGTTTEADVYDYTNNTNTELELE